MFTGIITDVGQVADVQRSADGMRAVIETRYPVDSIELGASIACSGVCLTVTERGSRQAQTWFSVDISEETISRTTVSDWRTGSRVNLERSLKLGDELGGHLVYGHVDGIATVVARRAEGESTRYSFQLPGELARFVAPKGSIALDGISLTVNEVEGDRFGVNIIPHTAANTTWDTLQEGARVNLEVDMLARYVARALSRD